MNTREIANTTGKDERSVRRWVKKAAVKMSAITVKMSASTSTNPADYDFEETLAIIEAGMGKNAADIYRTNSSASMPEVAKSGDSLTEKDIRLISSIVSMTVAETMKRLDERVAKIETRVEERQALLPAPQMSRRDHINKLAREYSARTGGNFAEAYSMLYREFGYRTHSAPSIAAKNRGMAIIDYIEAEGQIDTLEAVAMDILK